MSGYDVELAQNYSRERDKYTSTDPEVFTAIQSIGIKDKRILDFGCGDGRYSIKFADARKVIGIDISKPMIELANASLKKSDLKNIEFLEADGNKLPFDDNSFDIVFSNFVLVHFKDIRKPLKEIYRVLDKKGVFIATVNNAAFTDAVVRNSLIKIRLGGANGTTVYDYLKTDNETEQELVAAGFSVDTFKIIPNRDAQPDPSDPLFNKFNDFHCVLIVAKMK